MKRLALTGIVLVALLVGGAQAAGELTLTVVSQTNSTITLGWTPQAGYGYLFSVNGSLVSRTNDAARSSVKFSKVTNGVYEVAVIVKGATGTYPPPAPPPPKNQCEDGVDNDNDGLVDLADPGCSSATDNDETDPAAPPSSFPNATNTGVPPGTTLTAYTGPTTITTANTVIDGKTTGCLTIQALGVIIRNSKVICSDGWATSAWNSESSMTIQDSEIVCGPKEGTTGVVGDHITLRRVNIHGCENAMAADGDDTIEDSYFHDMYNGGNAHADGIQFPDGANNITIRHNTIITLGPGGTYGNLAGSINADTANHANWLIENNLLGGGAFTVYCVYPGKGTNWVIRNNAFMSNYGVGYSARCGDETQSGNYVFETLQPLTLG